MISWTHWLVGGLQQQQQYRYHQLLLQQQRRFESLAQAPLGTPGASVLAGGNSRGTAFTGTRSTARGQGVVVSVWEASGVWLSLKTLLLLCCTLPAAIHSARFLWSGVRRARVAVEILSLVPINLLSIYFADLQSVQLLGLTSMVAGAWQWYAATQTSERGKKII
jgi:hypothetical protein